MVKIASQGKYLSGISKEDKMPYLEAPNLMTQGGNVSHMPFQLISHRLNGKNYLKWAQFEEIAIEAPKDSCCEVCDKGKGSMLHASEKICQSIAPPRKHNKFPGSYGINWEKEIPLQRLLGSARHTNPQNVKNTKITEQIKNTVQDSKGFGELKSPGAANESPLMNPIMTHPCDPTLAHSWKGSFDIKGAPEFAPGMLNNCIQDYPPSKVRRKVYEFSRLLSGTLKFELVPTKAMWISLLNNHFPGKEDTRLYFLASEIERSEMYIALVEFLHNKDSVMRMLINYVELILITKSLICMNTTRAI
ncbi:putative flavonoid 3'-monooxygenase-like [Capsicum annuum]|nr:putative flavonoid 3'-monooxygenase-like [Capsicum annuum]